MHAERRPRQHGQVIVLMALGLVAMIAMVALIVDGGSLLAQQRVSQNGADAAAKSGTLVVAQELVRKTRGGGVPRTNAEVWNAINGSMSANGISFVSAWYTNDFGAPIGQAVVNNGNRIPDGAEGVRVAASRATGTTFARVIGFESLQAAADATVVAGPLAACTTGESCGVLPVTFPVAVSQCDGNDLVGIGTGIDTDGDGAPDTAAWPIVAIDQATPANRATVPLCGSTAGSVGWLDLEPGKNLQQEIEDPGSQGFDIPTWLQTQTGNVNAVEDEINDLYAGKIVWIPLFDGYCRVEPTGAQLTDCPNPNATGSNTWYHIPKFTAFLVDEVFINGNDSVPCEAAAETANPPVIAQWSGFESCLTGWFTDYATEGQIGPGGTLTGNEIVGIQLIR